jgi:4-amino-4-deoxy-L-arabinose transferase-like glycosyltransferase
VIVIAILVAAFGIRLAFIELTSYRPINDAGTYLKLAAEVANTGGYLKHDAGAGGSRGPSAYFAPAYPYFLGAVDLLDGHPTRAAPAIQPARISQAVLGTVAVGMIGLVAIEAFGPLVALIAMLLAAVYPVAVELSGTLVAENLLVPLMLPAIWAVLRARRAQRSYAWLAGAGVLAGLAALTHENAALLIGVLALAAWSTRPRWSLRALAGPALVVAVAIATIAPWTIRNAIVMHRFIPISDETGITLVGTYNPASAAFRPVPYRWRLYYGIPQDAALRREAPRLPEAVLADRLQRQAFDYIADHPLAPLKAGFHNTLRLLELEGSFAWQISYLGIGLSIDAGRVGVFSFWVLCLLALGGTVTASARRAPRWLWAAPLLFALTVVPVNVETPRFREPVDPFLIMLAACGVAALVRRAGAGRAGVGRSGDGPPAGRERGAAVAGGGEPIDVVERLS